MDIFHPLLNQISRRRYDSGDRIDQINYQYTSTLILVFALFVAGKIYIAEPIQCWVPKEFHSTWESYAENYCFIKTGNYYLRNDQPIEQDYRARRGATPLSWYQWVPVVLIGQALLFLVPSLAWRHLSHYTGLNVKSVLNSAAEVKNDLSSSSRDEKVELAAVHIQESLDTQRDLKPGGRLLGSLFYGTHYGTYVTLLYLFVKILYIGNVVGQFFLLNKFLDVINGRSWEESSHFPRVTMCDFDIRTLGNIHRWTVQCVLMINMFNEKIYLFLWWWFLLMSVGTIVSFIYWILAAFFNQRAFVEKYLRIYGCFRHMSPEGREQALDSFVFDNLRPDGVLMLRMIHGNGGDLLAGELTKALWDNWAERLRHKKRQRDQQTNHLREPGMKNYYGPNDFSDEITKETPFNSI